MTGKENYTHEELFGELNRSSLSAREAAEYLEIDITQLKIQVFSGNLLPTDGNIEDLRFSVEALRRHKRRTKPEVLQRDFGEPVTDLPDWVRPVPAASLEGYGEHRAQYYREKYAIDSTASDAVQPESEPVADEPAQLTTPAPKALPLDPSRSRGKPISREAMEAHSIRHTEKLLEKFGSKE